MEHSKKNVTFKTLPKWLRKTIVVLLFIIAYFIADYFFNVRSHAMLICDNSKTVQKYDVLRLSCATVVLDWWAIDDILSEMEIEWIDTHFQ